jgi:putative Ca2+/H+ antiporter (TMEM165/GDT1 family)
MLAPIVLTARYRRPRSVFIGVDLAILAHAMLAAAG